MLVSRVALVALFVSLNDISSAAVLPGGNLAGGFLGVRPGTRVRDCRGQCPGCVGSCTALSGGCECVTATNSPATDAVVALAAAGTSDLRGYLFARPGPPVRDRRGACPGGVGVGSCTALSGGCECVTATNSPPEDESALVDTAGTGVLRSGIFGRPGTQVRDCKGECPGCVGSCTALSGGCECVTATNSPPEDEGVLMP
jgi:hypothetical protein